MQKQLHFPTLGAKFLAIKRHTLKSDNMQQLYIIWIDFSSQVLYVYMNQISVFNLFCHLLNN